MDLKDRYGVEVLPSGDLGNGGGDGSGGLHDSYFLVWSIDLWYKGCEMATDDFADGSLERNGYLVADDPMMFKGWEEKDRERLTLIGSFLFLRTHKRIHASRI